MKILHCCLAAVFVDRTGYQENILPRMHRLQGHDVAILASTETYLNNLDLGYVEPAKYQTEDGIPVTRLAYTRWLPHKIARKLRIYVGLTDSLESFEPDIIFMHDCQFVDVRKVIRYIRKRGNVTVFVDGHTDFGNSGRNWVSKNILHRGIYRWCVKAVEPYTTRFWGTLPVREDFYHDVYGVDRKKISLLVMGADDTKIHWDQRATIRNTLRQSFGIADQDLLLITGGKIDIRKNILALMKVVSQLDRSDIKLLLFGTPSKDIEDEFNKLSKHPHIRSIGWIDAEKVYDYFFAADLAIFPGTHSVLWEQAVGTGLPC